MKFIATGDWHLSEFSDFSRKMSVYFNYGTGRYTETTEDDAEHSVIEMNSRLFDILNGICDMRDYAVSNDIHYILFAGDLFHKRGMITVSVFNAAYTILSTFHQVGVDMVAISGNHDDISNERISQTSIHTFGSIINVIESPRLIELDDVEIVAVPYSKDKEYVLDSIANLRNQCKDANSAILMCHLGITGGRVGSGMYSMKDDYSLTELTSSKWKYLIAGHYHQPQLLSENSIYTGTPVQNSFSDELPDDLYGGYNGFFVLETNKRYDIEFVPIKAPRFVTVKSVKYLSRLSEEFLRENHIRVVTDVEEVDNIKDTLTDIFGSDDQPEVRLELEKDYSVNQRSDINVTKSFEESVKIFATERYTGDIDKAVSVGLDILAEAKTGGVS